MCMDEETRAYRELVSSMQNGYAGEDLKERGPQVFKVEVQVPAPKTKTRSILNSVIGGGGEGRIKKRSEALLRLGDGYDPDCLIMRSVESFENGPGKGNNGGGTTGQSELSAEPDGQLISKWGTFARNAKTAIGRLSDGGRGGAAGGEDNSADGGGVPAVDLNFPMVIRFRDVGDLIPRGTCGLALRAATGGGAEPPSDLLVIDAPSRGARDYWLNGLMQVIAEYRRLREIRGGDDADSEDEEGFDESTGRKKMGIFNSFLNSAQRAKHFADREIEMQQRNAERSKKKEKYLGGGLKYTALAMAARNDA